MSRLNVLVTGATGQQGGRVARNLLKSGHQVRALVRDPGSVKSTNLQALGAELSVGEFDDTDSIRRAMQGVDSVFAVGTPFAGIEAEITQGKSLANTAVETGVNHFVYSSVAGADRGTGIPHFDSKNEVENYIRSKSLNWSVVAPVFFMDNVLFPWNLADFKNGVFRQALKPETSLQSISAENIGQFIAGVVSGGEKFFGKRIEIAADESTGPQMASALGAATGLNVAFETQPLEELSAQFADMALMYEWFGNTGFDVDIENLKSDYPEIGWTDFVTWTSSVQWPTLLAA